MKFKVDENLPREVADIFQDAGHDAETVHTERLQGARDPVVLDACLRENRVLVTIDQDFGDITRYPPRRCPGFVILRPHRLDKHHILDLISRVIELLSTEPLEHHLWIVEPSRVRIRNTEPS